MSRLIDLVPELRSVYCSECCLSCGFLFLLLVFTIAKEWAGQEAGSSKTSTNFTQSVGHCPTESP